MTYPALRRPGADARLGNDRLPITGLRLRGHRAGSCLIAGVCLGDRIAVGNHRPAQDEQPDGHPH
jgi:hypothetical protein